ncbi:uncharacterized protein LOC106085476 [Stomoxys calcitrans]|uniref:uncharacterized protein LOC106085476 n=1 Tax=Stomoxys calcitrans TaxID=35570 RepID=UPI0027E27248|nr:uncharacterized protein LOC106085476 [Stomoxys calcitrans]
MQSLANFKCHTNCKHSECLRNVPLGIVDKYNNRQCLKQDLNGSSMFLENVLDLAHTLAQIMIICGIHECKAKTSVDIITYSFLHYDLVCYCLGEKPSKRLRKEDIFHELGIKCLMNRVEAHLTYTIIKRGFKAFYYTPREEKCKTSEKPNFSEECLYVHAAKKTAESYAKFDGLSCDEQRGVEAKIKVAYKKFYDRMQARKIKPSKADCNCCFCAKNRGHLIYAKPPECIAAQQPKKPHSCPHCIPKQAKKCIHGKSIEAKCATCHRSRKFCSCPKYNYDIPWVNSIWSRPDMNLYYVEHFEKVPEVTEAGCHPQENESNQVVEDSPVYQEEEQNIEELNNQENTTDE